MKSPSVARHDSTVPVTTFVNERETVKLAEMLAIATEDLEHVSGGLAALAASTACCCCHHGSLA